MRVLRRTRVARLLARHPEVLPAEACFPDGLQATLDLRVVDFSGAGFRGERQLHAGRLRRLQHSDIRTVLGVEDDHQRSGQARRHAVGKGMDAGEPVAAQVAPEFLTVLRWRIEAQVDQRNVHVRSPADQFVELPILDWHEPGRGRRIDRQDLYLHVAVFHDAARIVRLQRERTRAQHAALLVLGAPRIRRFGVFADQIAVDESLDGLADDTNAVVEPDVVLHRRHPGVAHGVDAAGHLVLDVAVHPLGGWIRVDDLDFVTGRGPALGLELRVNIDAAVRTGLGQD